jgi:L-arabinose isomerase
MEDFAQIAGLETAIIDAKTNLRDFQQTLRNNEVYYHLAPGLGRL